ncbi:hypothetical protein D3C72_640760 [compost metagenome]
MYSTFQLKIPKVKRRVFIYCCFVLSLVVSKLVRQFIITIVKELNCSNWNTGSVKIIICTIYIQRYQLIRIVYKAFNTCECPFTYTVFKGFNRVTIYHINSTVTVCNQFVIN